jgi:predicted RNA binding protein YcfA (HicA-like mRNA interferase family)
MKKLSNISLADMRKALKGFGLNKIRTKGGHETWSKAAMTRPITIQTHVDPVPEFIVQQIIRNLGITKKGFVEIIEEKKKAPAAASAKTKKLK